MVFTATLNFSIILWRSVNGENNQPDATTCSHNFVSSTPRLEREIEWKKDFGYLHFLSVLGPPSFMTLSNLQKMTHNFAVLLTPV
jgi:hypothetical protein